MTLLYPHYNHILICTQKKDSKNVTGFTIHKSTSQARLSARTIPTCVPSQDGGSLRAEKPHQAKTKVELR